jgi:Na+-translocating ferredoxin:NAD+ oxidoreductase RnfD subunit
MFELKSIKTQLIVYLLCFSAFLFIKDRDTAFIFTTIIAVVSALVIESVILYCKTKIFQVTESSIITGLIIGYVLFSGNPLWIFVFASALAIFSKHIIRIREKHIFNPAAFGIFISTILFGASTQWQGTYLWYILVPFGIYFVYKLKKIEIVIGYMLISLLLFGSQAVLQKVSFWNIFGYFSYFYIFVMVIEPKTTPLKNKGKYLFGTGVAVLIFILTEAGARFDVELLSLLTMNIAVPLINRMPSK